VSEPVCVKAGGKLELAVFVKRVDLWLDVTAIKDVIIETRWRRGESG
jgi:hypothetical protein